MLRLQGGTRAARLARGAACLRAVPRRSILAVLLAVATALTACGSVAPSQEGAPPPGTRGRPAAIPSTTLPSQVTVNGTAVPGAAFLGLVRRVPVVAVAAGHRSSPMPQPGAAGYASMQRIAFRRFGAGPDLLLIMGQDGSMAWWEPSFLSVLAQHYRVTLFDLPGVGYSAPALAPVTLGWLSDETAGLIEALGLVEPNVLGWGLGGEVALDLAERHPGDIRSLVLVDTTAGGPGARRPSSAVSSLLDSPAATPASLASTLFADGSPSPSPGARTARASSKTTVGSPGSTPTAATAIRSSPGSSAAASAAAAWLGAVDATVPDNVTSGALAEQRAVQAEAWSSHALARDAGSVTVPTLVVFGSGDTVFPAPDGLMLRHLIAGSQRVELPDAGYAAIFEDSSQFVAALEQFTG